MALSSSVYPSMVRSSRRRCSVKRGALGSFTKFTGKHLCQCLFFNKVVRKHFLRTPKKNF